MIFWVKRGDSLIVISVTRFIFSVYNSKVFFVCLNHTKSVVLHANINENPIPFVHLKNILYLQSYIYHKISCKY